jgi:hypothetical protein
MVFAVMPEKQNFDPSRSGKLVAFLVAGVKDGNEQKTNEESKSSHVMGVGLRG